VLNGDPSVLDQTLVVNGHPLTIVGVAAQGFNGLQVGSTSDVIVPLMMQAQMTPTWNDLDNRRSRWLTIMGRLKPGIPADGAEVQLNVVYTQIKVVYEGGRPPVPATFTASLVSYGDRLLATSEDGDTFVIKAGPDARDHADELDRRAGVRLARARRRLDLYPWSAAPVRDQIRQMNSPSTMAVAPHTWCPSRSK
jgi:hypothetical protein